jgi:hypothetical protein
MRRALILAILGSVAIHLFALFGGRIELFAEKQEPLVLHAELRLPAPPADVRRFARRSGPTKKKPTVPSVAAQPVASGDTPPLMAAAPAEALPDTPGLSAPAEAPPAVAEQPAKPLLPASGAIRFAIHQESMGLLVGRAEHSWIFAEDGQYRLINVTETSGLVSLFKPIRVRAESRGRLVAGGLQPESYRTWKNGVDNRDGADFDWATRQVHLLRNDATLDIEPGAQDLLSLTYQLAYLEKPEQGSRIGIATVRKYEHYTLESLGEEDIDVPAGHFHTLHLRTRADTTTEIWIALDLHRLPVKIRYTDKKGDSYIQSATEIGSLAKPPQP